MLVVSALLPCGEVSAQVISPNRNLSGDYFSEIENEPSIAKQNSNVVVVWGMGDRDVRVAVSRDGGTTWSDSTLQSGVFLERLKRRAATTIDGNGTAFVAALGLSLQLNGQSVFMFRTTSQESVLWEQLPNVFPYVPFGKEALDGIRILADRASSVLYLCYTHRTSINENTIQFVRSTDSGGSWSAPSRLSGDLCNTAQLVLGPDGALFVAWEDYQQKAIIGRRSTDTGVSFGPEFAIGPIHDNLGFSPPGWHSSVSRDPPVDWRAVCMDVPAFIGLAADRSSGPYRGSLYAVWTEHGLGTVDPDPIRVLGETEPNDVFANATPIAIGDDVSGVMVSADVPPYTGDCDSFVFEGTAGTTIQIKGGATNCIINGPCLPLAMGVSVWGGGDVNALGRIGCGTVDATDVIPPVIYTLPHTGRYYLRMDWCYTPSTVFYAFSLREYHITPGQSARDHRDVVLARSRDGGTTWSDKVRVNDDLPRYDNSIPAVAVDDRGLVHVAWYDRRDEPDYSARVHTYWTFSDDGGVTFAPSLRVSAQPSDALGTLIDDGARWLVGDHLALDAEGDRVHLVWTHVPIGGGGKIYTSTITDVPTSTIVQRFAAELIAQRVRLRWSVGDGGEVVGFRVHRAVGDADFAFHHYVTARGLREYEWDDAAVVAGTEYRYRLEVVFRDRTSVWEGPVAVTVAGPAAVLRWRAAAPNPFSDSVELRLDAPPGVPTRVAVYDVMGHEVALVHPEPAADHWIVRWNGRDERGRIVAPGVYLVRAERGAASVTQRVIRMR
jgi:hypothetical protein